VRGYYVRGSLKQRRWLKKNLGVRRAALRHGLEQFYRRERGWLWVWDEEDRVTFAHHWLALKPVIHNGRKT
jgi:hypothetical protein